MGNISRDAAIRAISFLPKEWRESAELALMDVEGEPERKKDVIQSFHDYQIEWLTSHCDLELEPVLESWVVRFLHDTANCYMMEVEHAEV